MFGIHRHPLWGDDFGFIRPPPQRSGLYVPRDDFLEALQVKHWKDDLYYVMLPRCVLFKQMNLQVREHQLVFTYLPTKATCSFRLPRDIDIDRIEAKRIESDHSIVLYLPKIRDDEEESVPEVTDDSSRSGTPPVHSSEPEEDVDSFIANEEVKEDPDEEPVAYEIPVFTAVHPVSREEMTFEEMDVPHDHDCAFHCIGLSREEACDLLLKNQDNLEVRKIVAPEIEESFIGFQLPKEMEQDELVKKLRAEFFEATEMVSEGVRKAKEKLEGLGIPCNHMDAKQIVTKYRWCQSISILGIVQELMKSINVLKDAEKRISAYCVSKEAYVAFVKYYLFIKGNWAGYLRSIDGKQRTSSLDAIAVLKSLKLYIWVATEGNKLDLIHESPVMKELSEKEDYEVIHMLHTNQLSHFNLLAEI
jgi:hypothetical protein